MKRPIPFCLVLLSSLSAMSQGEVPVDFHIGKPLIGVPLVTVSSHELSDAVSLVYDAGGIRVQQPSGKFGIGWDLQAGGSIRREVRSLPDEFLGTGSDTRRGWFN